MSDHHAEHTHEELPLAEQAGCGDGCACGDGEGYETGLDPALAELLEAAGLDPVEVEDIATLALAEDLAGGVDVTCDRHRAGRRGRHRRLHRP